MSSADEEDPEEDEEEEFEPPGGFLTTAEHLSELPIGPAAEGFQVLVSPKVPITYHRNVM